MRRRGFSTLRMLSTAMTTTTMSTAGCCWRWREGEKKVKSVDVSYDECKEKESSNDDCRRAQCCVEYEHKSRRIENWVKCVLNIITPRRGKSSFLIGRLHSSLPFLLTRSFPHIPFSFSSLHNSKAQSREGLWVCDKLRRDESHSTDVLLEVCTWKYFVALVQSSLLSQDTSVIIWTLNSREGFSFDCWE